MAKFLNRVSGGLYMGPSPLWGDEPIADELYTELREYPSHLRVDAAEMIRFRGAAETAADASDAAVEAFNSALHEHEDAMSALGDIKAAGEAARADGGTYPADEVLAAELAADELGRALAEARKKMHAAQTAYTAAIQAVMAASASLNSRAA